MERRLVSLYAWVHDRRPSGQPPGQPPGRWPGDPNFGVPGWPGQDLPGNQPYPDQGLPGYQPYPDQGLPGNQPYPDQGLPGYQPYPDQSLPGYQPYPDQGLPGNQPGIWPGPRPPYIDIGFPGPQPGGPVYPDQGLPGNQPYPDQSLPGYQPYPDQSLPGNQPGIWGPTDPRPSQPIYLPPPQNIPGLKPMQPIYSPGPPSLDPENLPEHPEVPDLNTGRWSWIQDPDTRQSVAAFVTFPLVVTHPDYNPQYPPQETQPGRWVLTLADSFRMTWAWIPERPEPNRDLPGAQPKKAAAAKTE